MNIVIGSDHAGLELKNQIITHLKSKSIIGMVEDIGCYINSSCDYPEFAHAVSKNLFDGPYHFGILICGTGQGMAMTANKYQHIRAGVCWNSEIAKFTREHNNSNVLCLPARFMDKDEAFSTVNTFLSTAFSNEERHSRRVQKISKI
jgi:ribose 5-phosphate isomerase B